jgi:hypothetical protein
MYLAYLSYSTQAKNKLEVDFEKYLIEIDRTLIENDKIEWLKYEIINKYKLLCDVHSRCKPIKKDFSRFETNGDCILYGSNVVFKLLKSK